MTTNHYRSDPCGASSLPYWKTKRVVIPPHMRIMREEQFESGLLDTYTDEPYFKLRHDLTGVERPKPPEGFELIVPTPELLSRHIARCYEHERLSVQELRELQGHFTYRPELWLALAEQGSGKAAASGIAGLDPEIGEGTLEWIQVSPQCRRQGLGKYVVNELLYRMKDLADFVTVSGRVNNQTRPEKLYEKCGFQDKVVWHILFRRNHIETEGQEME